MREVTGAFCGSRKLDEALEDLRAEGIAVDRIRVASASGFDDIQMSIALSASSPTQWITAEHAGYAEYFGASGPLFGAADDSESPSNDILPDFHHRPVDDGAQGGLASITRVVVSIRDEAEMRAVCDIFSRLGTDDIDVESAAA